MSQSPGYLIKKINRLIGMICLASVVMGIMIGALTMLLWKSF